jgi:SPP1 family predicted phage head-tail adaptor
MISQFKKRIIFKSKTGVSDGAGGFVNTLSTYYTCWAQVVSDTNVRTNIAGKDSINDNVLFRIRYTTDKVFTNALVISYKSNTYMINSIINEEDLNLYYLINCSTLKNG